MDINLPQYVKAFQKQWWLIPAVVLLSVGFGLAYSMSQTPLYEASSILVVGPDSSIDDPRDLLSGLNDLARYSGVAVTSCKILESQAIRERAAVILGISLKIASSYQIGCVVLPDSTILKLSVQGVSPKLAADLVNAISTTGTLYIGNLYEVVDLHVLDLAAVDTNPISPNHVTNIMLSLIVGLVGGVGFIILRETLVQLLTPSSVSEQFSPLTLSVITLRTVNEFVLDKQIEQQLTGQLRMLIQQNGRPDDSVLCNDYAIYPKRKQYILLMPNTRKEEARALLVPLIEQLRAVEFTMPNMDTAIRYIGSVGIVENKDNVLMWRESLQRGRTAAMQAEIRGEWKIYVDEDMETDVPTVPSVDN